MSLLACLHVCVPIRMGVPSSVRLFAGEAQSSLPRDRPPPQPPRSASVGLAHRPNSSPLLFQARAGTGEPRLAGLPSEVGEGGRSPERRVLCFSQVTGTAPNTAARGAYTRALSWPRPGLWRLAGHREDF